jgi:DNA-binding CsgD family transcriptional regulator
MKGFALAGPILQAAFAVELLIIILIVVQLYFGTGTVTDKNRKRLARNLANIYLACLSIMVLFGVIIRVPIYIYPDLLFFQVIVAFLYFFINIPPLFYLSIFLKKHHGKLGFQPRETKSPEYFYSRFNITPREQEIIDRIIKGKTNEEIGDELFISTKTVKNNISNIYKKTGVNNRVQLTNLIRDL